MNNLHVYANRARVNFKKDIKINNQPTDFKQDIQDLLIDNFMSHETKQITLFMLKYKYCRYKNIDIYKITTLENINLLNKTQKAILHLQKLFPNYKDLITLENIIDFCTHSSYFCVGLPKHLETFLKPMFIEIMQNEKYRQQLTKEEQIYFNYKLYGCKFINQSIMQKYHATNYTKDLQIKEEGSFVALNFIKHDDDIKKLENQLKFKDDFDKHNLIFKQNNEITLNLQDYGLVALPDLSYKNLYSIKKINLSKNNLIAISNESLIQYNGLKELICNNCNPVVFFNYFAQGTTLKKIDCYGSRVAFSSVQTLQEPLTYKSVYDYLVKTSLTVRLFRKLNNGVANFEIITGGLVIPMCFVWNKDKVDVFSDNKKTHLCASFKIKAENNFILKENDIKIIPLSEVYEPLHVNKIWESNENNDFF